MRIYNSLTRQLDEFEPPETGRIGIYVCGPTVYDEPHIGHARSAYIFDVIIRYLRCKFGESKVVFVRNVTDIDDKIIDRARREKGGGDLKERAAYIAQTYLERYHEAMDMLGLARPDIEPKATETIGDMLAFIKALIDKGFAYEASGSVYFDVRKFKDYGGLSHQSAGEMMEGARVGPEKSKKDSLDFALWKAAKEDEPSWDSPWGKGRPGWHIECSVMSTKFLGDDFLIHGGGLDLIFPHHENEIAQTVSAGRKSARYWIHNGLLTINGQKMSKSLGNFISIDHFFSKYKDMDLLKLLFLSSHYRHPVDYSEARIDEMKKAKERIITFFDKAVGTGEGGKVARKVNMGTTSAVTGLETKFYDAMDDDFNTPAGLAAIFDLVSLGFFHLSKDDAKSVTSIKAALSKLCSIFGIAPVRAESHLDEKDQMLIKERDAARQRRDFKKADQIRDVLLDKGIILEDTKDDTIWRRKA